MLIKASEAQKLEIYLFRFLRVWIIYPTLKSLLTTGPAFRPIAKVVCWAFSSISKLLRPLSNNLSYHMPIWNRASKTNVGIIMSWIRFPKWLDRIYKKHVLHVFLHSSVKIGTHITQSIKLLNRQKLCIWYKWVPAKPGCYLVGCLYFRFVW